MGRLILFISFISLFINLGVFAFEVTSVGSVIELQPGQTLATHLNFFQNEDYEQIAIVELEPFQGWPLAEDSQIIKYFKQVSHVYKKKVPHWIYTQTTRLALNPGHQVRYPLLLKPPKNTPSGLYVFWLKIKSSDVKLSPLEEPPSGEMSGFDRYRTKRLPILILVHQPDLL